MYKKVLVDAGHGGSDDGAVVENVNESDLNLDVSMALGYFLNKRGYQTEYTRVRNEAWSLSARLEYIRQFKPDAFVSIHCNAIADNPETQEDEHALVRGFELYYRDDGDLPLAKTIEHYLERTSLRNRGSHRDVERLGKRLTVLDDFATPSCLVELGYITNNFDREFILHHTQALADLIGWGIVSFLGGIGSDLKTQA